MVHKDFNNIMRFGQRMYNQGHGSCSEQNTWQDVMRLLHEAGYKDPTTYYVCLSESHYCNWDLMESVSEMCKISGAKGTIPLLIFQHSRESAQMWNSESR